MNGKHLITPGKTLLGISLEENIESVISDISNNYSISRDAGIVSLNDGEIVIGHEDNGIIYSVMCDKRSNARYENKLWPGMSVKDVLDNSKEQIAFGGCVVIDRINGIGLPLPNDFDDFERITDFLSMDFVFEYLSIFRV
ncbi:hypothetical protein [Pectobacterium parmentieri]|uniref:hypothetical protein n=1 Tax=Pectobacterium parmentieri TaxID=1905730 RepID=UPI0001B0A756|nr:hypothetical protein [Pectobacterium parmentieri]ACX86203.1 hypothetical protein Pecwa_0351 [Pectobacterium parmentieri WPP163]MBI0552779.1 hypothetical protein [Pectobacterium parmentieri]MBI0561798.1 hypothetical protein [Pectobacterium parmentieri]MBI0566077.1 hypothetical protein [Pectobacterium parmentieri]PWD68139.1 hypothetical protein DF211_00855 [Pectobacterium parmentieri]